MNNIRAIKEINKREIEAGVSTSASWHSDYRDTAFLYIGGLPYELSEGDIVTIFSQFGEPVFVNLVRDKETGKSKGFAFLKYEDQRSTDLAVDNLGGATIMGRILKVDHTRYKRKDGEELGDNTYGEENGAGDSDGSGVGSDNKRRKHRRDRRDHSQDAERPMLQEERGLAELIRDHDEDDPMKEYLVKEKREEVEMALAKVKSEDRHHSKHRKHSDRHHRSSHRSERSHRHHDDDDKKSRREKR